MTIALDAAFYDLTQEAGSAVLAWWRRGRAPRAVAAEPLLLQLRQGYAESPSWFLVQAMEFDPEPLTVANLRVRDVYASERIVAALLELMASARWLDRDATGAYRLSAEGRALTQHIRPRADDILAPAGPARRAARLAEFLHRIVDAGLRGEGPPGSWCLAHSRRRAPAGDSAPLVRLCQYAEDLNALRDDGHMAAWRPYGTDGYEWEAFDVVCSVHGATGGEIFDLLAHRGYSHVEYGAALTRLADRRWLERRDGGTSYRASPEGRAARAEVERRTDAYFYAAWSALTAAEIAAIRDALVELRDGLR